MSPGNWRAPLTLRSARYPQASVPHFAECGTAQDASSLAIPPLPVRFATVNAWPVHLRLGEGALNIWRHSREEEILRRAIAHLHFEFTKYEQSLPAKTLLPQCPMELGLPDGAELMITKFIGTLNTRDWAMRGAYPEAYYILGEIRERRGDQSGTLIAYMILASQDIGFGDTLGRIRALQAKMTN
jgi:hypothetical protein